MLKIELQDLDAEGFDLSLTGFNPDEIGNFLAEPTEGLTDEDAVPEVPAVPVTVEGDVWILGRHRLMCGDSTSQSAFDGLMGGVLADMIFTDPPYGMSYGGGRARGEDQKFKNRSGGIKSHGMIMNDDLQGDDLIALVRDAIATSTACMKSGGALYACFTWRTYAEFEAGLESCGHKVKACIVWDKKSIGLGNSNYRPQHEFIFYCGGQWYGDKSQSDVWYMSRGATGDYVHPTQKPVELVERALNNSSKAGDIVIDCFGGSGSTLIACEKTARSARLMELDPKYCDVIVKRWQEFTGQQATLEATGETFETVSGGRA
jgi:DNA modification methylase